MRYTACLYYVLLYDEFECENAKMSIIQRGWKNDSSSRIYWSPYDKLDIFSLYNMYIVKLLCIIFIILYRNFSISS